MYVYFLLGRTHHPILGIQDNPSSQAQVTNRNNDHISSGYVKIAIENDHWNSGFSH